MNGLMSTSDFEYLSEQTTSNFDMEMVTTDQNHSVPHAEDQFVSAVPSGNVQSASSEISGTQGLNNLTQNHSVQISPLKSTSVVTQNVSHEQVLDPGVETFVTSSSDNLVLATALGNMNLLGTPQTHSVIPGPFQVVGQTDALNVHPNEITNLQILDSHGVPINIPIQVLNDNAASGSSIHVLSLVEEANKDGSVPNVTEKKESSLYQDKNNLSFSEPCKTSTPAGHLETLNDTIVAGSNFHPTPFNCSGESSNETSPIQKKNSDGHQNSASPDKEELQSMKQQAAPINIPVQRNSNKRKYSGVLKKPNIAVIPEGVETDDTLGDKDTTHNNTYCRQWIESTNVEPAVKSKCTDSSAEKNTDTVRNVDFKRGQVAQSDFESNVSKSVTQKNTEVKAKRKNDSVLGTLSTNVTNGSDNHAPKQTMYVQVL